MRLDKFLAHAELGSRKEVKAMIRKKRVSVNGEIDTKDDLIIDEVQDVICVDEMEIYYNQEMYIMLNKPQGYLSATEDSRDPCVVDLIPEVGISKCFPVGRLDKDSEGLLLITNNGQLTHRLLSPKHHVVKKYYIEMREKVTDEMIVNLCNGSIVLDDKPVKEAAYTPIDDMTGVIEISEGRFHQVKRMMEAVGNEVLYLKRIQMGPLVLDEDLALGEYRFLSEEEVQSLLELL
jgi:16S rRNA pseudouridine516 synthase